MTRKHLLLLALAGLLSMSGCANNAQTGTGVGALSGALAGSLLGPSKNKEAYALFGGLIGGALGYAIGNEMDKQDLKRLNSTLDSAPSNHTTRWVNPDTGKEFAVTPRPPQARGDQVCREAEIISVIDGRRETMVTNACRLPDGRWEVRPQSS
ncbi:MAG: hypothetical protein HQL66_03740 [Magnetococcales bacterium]|nr:hypothetical protein [Magnetococcales bacterium]